MVTIYCYDCLAPREIKPQDVFQVKRCVPCQKKYSNEQRKFRAQAKRQQQQWAKEDARIKAAWEKEQAAMLAKWAVEAKAEKVAELDACVARIKEAGKPTWADYCFIKWDKWDLNTGDAIKSYGSDLEEYTNFDEDDENYYRSLGYTEEEITGLRLERGADNFIMNEFECSATETYEGMKIWIDWAYDRVNKWEGDENE